MKKASPYRPLTYLACPYSHPDPDQMQLRFEMVTRAGAELMTCNPRLNIFSPITHSHPLHKAGMDGSWKTWKRIDTEYLRLSKQLYVFTLGGWSHSVGVTAEIAIAKRLGIPIFCVAPYTYEIVLFAEHLKYRPLLRARLRQMKPKQLI